MSAQTRAKLAIFGGTGLTGRQLLTLALDRGMEVVALARQPSKLAEFHGSLKVIEGSATDVTAVERAVTGSNAVLSAMGQVKDSPPDILTTASLNIVGAMKKSGVRRVVILTDTSVEDPGDSPPFRHRILRGTLRLINGKLARDSTPAAEAVSGSGLDWTVVRAAILTNGPRRGRYSVGPLAVGRPLRVSRADVAEFMLSCATEGRFVNQRPVIGG